jgi:hypothetical protein
VLDSLSALLGGDGRHGCGDGGYVYLVDVDGGPCREFVDYQKAMACVDSLAGEPGGRTTSDGRAIYLGRRG